ncbi:hypothetical protein O77CONTIG1_00490 [Leptolyngbya sp. O-77]|nr:hypothetical protein O77CONTIG1_00490 [Leptolyngbya sp. O-77]
MLNYENHMEVRLVKDKEPPPPSNDAGKAVVTITTISIAVSLALKVMLPDINLNPAIASPNTTPPVEDFPTEWPNNPPPSVNAPSTPVPGPDATDRYGRGFFQIVECGTIYPAAANFRAYPGLANHGIRGVVPHGEWVLLTGLVSYADGILWHQVVNQSRLWPSFELGAFNQLDRNQLGWVAGCFV